MAEPTRRALLASSGLAAVGMASAEFPQIVFAAAPDPDARLVELGATFHAYHSWEGVPEPADDAEASAYANRWVEALAEIVRTPAAGLAGVAVKARCLVCEARDGQSDAFDALIDGLLADLDRLAPVAGGPARA